MSNSEKQIVCEAMYAIPFCEPVISSSKSVKKYNGLKDLPENKLSILIHISFDKIPNLFYIIDDLSEVCKSVPISEKIKCIISKDPHIMDYYTYFLPEYVATLLKVKYKDQIELFSFYKKYYKKRYLTGSATNLKTEVC